MGIREVPGAVSTAAQDKLQPWQAVFAVFTFVITQFDLSNTNTLILVGMVSVTLGFVMKSTYQHKEKVKEVVAPWLLQQALKVLKEYMPELPVEPVAPEEPELSREQLIEELEKVT